MSLVSQCRIYISIIYHSLIPPIYFCGTNIFMTDKILVDRETRHRSKSHRRSIYLYMEKYALHKYRDHKYTSSMRSRDALTLNNRTKEREREGKKKRKEKKTTKSKTDAGHTKWLDKYVAGPWLRQARAAPVSP